MTNLAWLSFVTYYGNCRLLERRPALESLLLPRRGGGPQTPLLVLLIGRKRKNALLRHALSVRVGCGGHGGVQLCVNAACRRMAAPIVFVDCELHTCEAPEQSAHQHRPCDVLHGLAESENGPHRDWRARAIGLYATALAPFAATVCIFADDIGGMEGVAQFVTDWLAAGPTYLEPPSVASQLLIVIETPARGLAEVDALTHLREHLPPGSTGFSRAELSNRLERAFNEVSTAGIARSEPVDVRLHTIWERLRATTARAKEDRTLKGRLLATGHLGDLLQASLAHFSRSPEQAVLPVEIARGERRVSPELSHHIVGLMGALLACTTTADAALEGIVARWTASALVLDSCPPGAPGMSTLWVARSCAWRHKAS